MNMTLKPAFGLSGSALKVIAMISMVIEPYCSLSDGARYRIIRNDALYRAHRFSCVCLPDSGRIYPYKKQVQVFLYSAGLCRNQ